MGYSEEVGKRFIKEKKMYGPRSEIFDVLETGYTIQVHQKHISCIT
jgi:hypothetical protein